MIIAIQLLLVAILAVILITLYGEESRVKKAQVPTAQLKGLWDCEERREAVRIANDLEVKYRLKENSENETRGRSKDISTGGLRMALYEKLIPGNILKIDIALAAQKDILTLTGEVVWVKELDAQNDTAGRRMFDVGIKFINVKPGQEAALGKYVKDELTNSS